MTSFTNNTEQEKEYDLAAFIRLCLRFSVDQMSEVSEAFILG